MHRRTAAPDLIVAIGAVIACALIGLRLKRVAAQRGCSLASFCTDQRPTILRDARRTWGNFRIRKISYAKPLSSWCAWCRGPLEVIVLSMRFLAVGN